MHCFDNNYVIPAGVAFYSMLEHACSDYRYELYVLHSDITIDNQQVLKKTIEKFPNAQLNFIKTNYEFNELFKKLKSKGYFSKEMFYKFVAPYVFQQYDKIIVSDVDVVYLGDISQVFNEFNITENYYVFGLNWNSEKDKEFKKRVYKNYNVGAIEKLLIGAGFMVYNLKKMREENIQEELIKFANDNVEYLKLPEQEAINFVCYPRIKVMPDNFVACIGNLEDTTKLEDLSNIIQLHYAVENKPWKAKCLLADVWFKYLLKTPLLEKYLELVEEKSKPKTKVLFKFKLPFSKKAYFLKKSLR